MTYERRRQTPWLQVILAVVPISLAPPTQAADKSPDEANSAALTLHMPLSETEAAAAKANSRHKKPDSDKHEIAAKPVVPTPTPPPALSKGPKSLFELDQVDQGPQGLVTACINVPHHHKAVDTFIAYPWPIQPPRVETVRNLPVEESDLKALLLQSGYMSRSSPDKLYPIGGWRWQYAYKEALNKSGRSEPHLIVNMYHWMHTMLPYAQRECIKSNFVEAKRRERYMQALREYETSHEDIANEAARVGLAPVGMKINSYANARAKLAPGRWWITSTRRVSGLTYYWLQPVTIEVGKTVALTCNQDNALVITGSW